jgi:hypothetical protein
MITIRGRRGYRLTAGILILFFTGCAPVIVYSPPLPFHGEVIHKTIKNVAEELKKSPYIVKNKIYEILNIESAESSQDDKLDAVIKDVFTRAIIEKEGLVAERDDDVLAHILLESGERKFSGFLTYKYPPEEWLDKIRPFYEKPEISLSGGALLFPEYEKYAKDIKLTGREVVEGEEKKIFYVGKPVAERILDSSIMNPDYIITYRIYECGVRFYPERSDEDEVVREARTDVFVEIIDAQRGIVVWSSYLTSMVKDKIPAEFVNALKESGYVFFGYTHPTKLRGEESKWAPVVGEEKEETVPLLKKKEESEPAQKKREESLKPARFRKISLHGMFSMSFVGKYKSPESLSSSSFGGQVDFSYKPIKYLGAGGYFGGTNGDYSIITAGVHFRGQYPFLNQYITPFAGFRIGYTAFSVNSEYVRDEINFSPEIGLELLPFIGGFISFYYNLSLYQGGWENFSFENTSFLNIGIGIRL